MQDGMKWVSLNKWKGRGTYLGQAACVTCYVFTVADQKPKQLTVKWSAKSGAECLIRTSH